MNRAKKIFFAVVLLFIVMQFIRPALNKTNEAQAADMITHFNIQENVADILRTSCYDCHSNNTQYPWYTNIQPAGWLLAKHIRDGKEDLNFSEFANYSDRRQLSKLKAIKNSIEDASMPLSSYTFIHADAKLSKESKALILTWAAKTIDSLSGSD